MLLCLGYRITQAVDIYRCKKKKIEGKRKKVPNDDPLHLITAP
jgi:hypothetical protein